MDSPRTNIDLRSELVSLSEAGTALLARPELNGLGFRSARESIESVTVASRLLSRLDLAVLPAGLTDELLEVTASAKRTFRSMLAFDPTSTDVSAIPRDAIIARVGLLGLQLCHLASTGLAQVDTGSARALEHASHGLERLLPVVIELEARASILIRALDDGQARVENVVNTLAETAHYLRSLSHLGPQLEAMRVAIDRLSPELLAETQTVPARRSKLRSFAIWAGLAVGAIVLVFFALGLLLNRAQYQSGPSPMYRVPPIGRSPTSSAARPPTFRGLVTDAVRDQMADADVAFEKHREMAVKKSEVFLARIAAPSFDRQKLIQGIKSPAIRRIVASSKMRLTLTADSDAFRIEPVGPQGGDQLLLPDRAATWMWHVLATKDGEFDLNLHISALVRIDGRDEVVGVDFLTCKVTAQNQPFPELMKEASGGIALKLYQNLTELLVTAICSAISGLLLFFYRDRVRDWFSNLRDRRRNLIIRP